MHQQLSTAGIEKWIEISRGARMSPDEYLTEISKRLEEGWALLNQHCPMPSCGIPLLRDPRGQVYCSKCEMFCISPKEAQLLVPSDGNARLTLKGEHSSGEENEVESSRVTAEGARAAAEARMGEKLLLGWTMLADACPASGCFFPLMLDPNRNTICVACGGGDTAEAVASDSASVEDTANLRAPSSSVPAPATAAPVLDESETEAGERPLMSCEEFKAAAKKRDDLGAVLGRYMLKGWSLLDRTCPREECKPGSPLLKDPTSGTLYCAACDTRMSDGRQHNEIVLMGSTALCSSALPGKRDSAGATRKLAPRTEIASASKIKPMQVESEYEIAERARLRKQVARDRTDNCLTASAGLAECLRQGWAMLSKACPRPGCHSPLMRDRSGTEVCVSCSAADLEGNSAQCPVKAAVDLMGEKGNEEETEEDREMVNGAIGHEYANQRMAELTGDCTLTASAYAAAAGVQDAVDHGGVKKRTLNALYRALDVSQQRLNACAGKGSVGIDESARQADLIAKLALAARAVCDLPTGMKCVGD